MTSLRVLRESADRFATPELIVHEAGLDDGLRRYQTMFERSSVGQLIVDFPSFRIDVVNPAFCAMTGFTATELVGRGVAVIFPVGQDPIANTLARLADRATDGYSVERMLQRRDGTTFPVLSTLSAVRDDDGTPLRLLVLMQDLTQQWAAEGTQRRSQAVIDAAIATLPVTFMMLDNDLRFTYIAGGLDRIATRREDSLGKHVSEIIDDPVALVAFEQALAGIESRSRTLVNGENYLILNAPMRNDDRAIVGVISVTTDITAEVSAEANRRQTDELRLYAARHDPLTGLLGRSALVEHLNHLAFSGQDAGTLLMLDLDDFHLINDSLGYTVGDAVLLEVAGRMSDAFSGLVVARQGGDEFAVLAPSVVDRADAMEAAERVAAALRPVVQIGHHTLRITASVGLALEQAHGPSATLMRKADLALSRAKHAGRGQYRVYDAEMRRQTQDRLGIQDGLRVALSTGQLRVAYQPIVSLSNRRIIGAEALLRWTHPERGPVSPEEFIPIAEQSGLIVPIGRWVMNTACGDAVSLQRAHDMYVCVNVSMRQLLGGGFAEWVEEVLARTGLASRSLTVEVTESALMDDLELVRTAFDRLRSQGIRVAIDDFGTGYSSLARLQHLPVDVIKLDRAFVTDVDVRAEARRMAAAILQVSAAIGASLIAEGIETEAEAATLLDLGYTTGQGYLFAHPMPLGDLTARLCAEALR